MANGNITECLMASLPSVYVIWKIIMYKKYIKTINNVYYTRVKYKCYKT